MLYAFELRNRDTVWFRPRCDTADARCVTVPAGELALSGLTFSVRYGAGLSTGDYRDSVLVRIRWPQLCKVLGKRKRHPFRSGVCIKLVFRLTQADAPVRVGSYQR